MCRWRLVLLLLLGVLRRSVPFCPLATTGKASRTTVGTNGVHPPEIAHRDRLHGNCRSHRSNDSCIEENETFMPVKPKVRRKYETFQWIHENEQGEPSSYNINYRVEGPVDGPPILLVHGFGANVGHFRYQFPALTKAGYRVYAIDLLGFGASDKPGNAAYSIELFADLLKDFILEMDKTMIKYTNDLPQKKWVVAGNSIGGLCSLAVSQLLPDLIRGVVLFNCSGGMSVFRDEYVPFIFRPILYLFKNVLLGPRLGRYFFARFKTRENVESVLKSQGVYRNTSRVDDELLEILLEPGNDEGAETVFLKVFGGPPGPTPESILPKMQCPILALWGGDDPWLKVDSGMHPGTEFHRYVGEKGAFNLVVLPNVGHCPHDEAYIEVNSHMISWMESLPLI